MEPWAEKEAEKLLDDFVDYEGADDLLRLQNAIAQALSRAYERGRTGQRPDEIAPS
jgi:hypothetical protein